jgi:metal-responsive CopG/Arc/MetJ family transcriptional regulator
MPKTKISVTVDTALVERLDHLEIDATRSEIVEMALAQWLRDARRQALEEEIEKYYTGLTERDKEEDAEWAGLASSALGETWK